MKNTVVTIVGARPQFIKVLPLVRDLKRAFDSKLIHTGQHYDYGMSEVFFEKLDIPKPDLNLNVGSGLHGAQTAMMLQRIEKALKKYAPSLVIVVGDTNSTLGGTLAAAKMNIPVAHIEAGLRSYRMSMPEEINRVVSDRLSSVLFCPTRNAVRNLRKEGITDGVFLTGDIMFDSLKMVLPACRKNRGIMDALGLKNKGYYLLTLHRDFNTDSRTGLGSLIKKLDRFGEKIVFPIHPRTRKAVRSFGLWDTLKNSRNLEVIDPLGYIDFLTLQARAAMVITDSGGVQKEAYMLRVPCLTLRDETEWVETLKGKANRLAGRYGAYLDGAVRPARWRCDWSKGAFGTGRASEKIVKVLERGYAFKRKGT